MITVTAAAPTYDLTTVEVVKRSLNLTGVEDDQFLTELISRASAALARITQRIWAREELTETIAGSGWVELVLSRVPIVTLAEVRRDDSVVSDVVVSDRDAGLLFHQSGFGRDDIATRFIKPWPTGAAALDWEVDYVAGYWLPSFPTNLGTELAPKLFSADDVRLPGDVEQACIDTVRTWYAARTRDLSKTSERLGDWSATYGESQVPDPVRKDLELNWRRMLL